MDPNSGKDNLAQPILPTQASVPSSPPPVNQPQSVAPPVNQPHKEGTSKKRTAFAIFLLIFFYLFGVIFVWFFTKWPRWAKILTILPIFLAILAIIISVILIAVNPARQFGQANDTRRASQTTQILNAVGAYSLANNGSLPSGITNTSQEISEAGADLCEDLIPTYMPALPTDPSLNINDIESDCPAEYKTGYTILLNPDNTVTVSAPNTEGDTEISITR